VSHHVIRGIREILAIIRGPCGLSSCNEVILSKYVSRVGIVYTLYNQYADRDNG